MIRKLFALAVMVVAAFAFSAVSASAQEVEVENPGMFEITGEDTIAIHSIVPQLGGLEATGLKCDNQWEANIDSSGHVDIHDIVLEPHDLSIGPCDVINDCDDAGWEGQVEEHHPHWEYAVHVEFCLENLLNAEFNEIPFLVECEISAAGDEAHCGGPQPGDGIPDEEESESHVRNHEIVTGVNAEFNVEGEVFIDPPLELMHVDG